MNVANEDGFLIGPVGSDGANPDLCCPSPLSTAPSIDEVFTPAADTVFEPVLPGTTVNKVRFP